MKGDLERALLRERLAAGFLLLLSLGGSGAAYLAGREGLVEAPRAAAGAVVGVVTGVLVLLGLGLGAWLRRSALAAPDLEEHLGRRTIACVAEQVVLTAAALFAAVVGALFGLGTLGGLAALVAIVLQVLAFPDLERALAARAAFRTRPGGPPGAREG